MGELNEITSTTIALLVSISMFLYRRYEENISEPVVLRKRGKVQISGNNAYRSKLY
jgi:hypothetical protein